MTETFDELGRIMDEVSLSSRQLVRIRVCDLAPAQSMVDVPLLGADGAPYRNRGIKEPRELLVHPDDWERIKSELTEISTERQMETTETVIGLPVVGV